GHGGITAMFTAPKIADTAGREARAMVSAAVFDREFDLAARCHGIAGQLALVADLCGDCDYSAARKIFERASSALQKDNGSVAPRTSSSAAAFHLLRSSRLPVWYCHKESIAARRQRNRRPPHGHHRRLPRSQPDRP